MNNTNYNPVCAVSVPHPPLIIPEIGKGGEKEIRSTVEAYRRAASFVREHDPDTIVVITPHTVMYSDYNHISPGVTASGDFLRYRAKEVRFHVKYDSELIAGLCAECAAMGISAGTEGERDASLDHGTMIPLYFLRGAYGGELNVPIVRIGLSGLPLADHYRFGKLIRQTGIVPEVKTSSGNMETLIEMCYLGEGVCFCPEKLLRNLLSEDQLSAMTVLRFPEGGTRYTVQFGWPDEEKDWPLRRDFIRLAKTAEAL